MFRKYISHRKAEIRIYAGTVGIGLQAGNQIALLTDASGRAAGGADGGGAGGTAAQTEILLFIITHSGPSPLSPTLPQFSSVGKEKLR